MKKLGKGLVLALAICLVLGGIAVYGTGGGGNTAKPEWGYIAPTTI